MSKVLDQASEQAIEIVAEKIKMPKGQVWLLAGILLCAIIGTWMLGGIARDFGAIKTDVNALKVDREKQQKDSSAQLVVNQMVIERLEALSHRVDQLERK